MKRLLSVLLTAACLGTSAWAANVRVSFEVGYETGFFSDKSNDETKKKVLPMARQEIWKSYVGRQDSSTIALLEKHKEVFNKRLEEVISNIEFGDEQVLKDVRRMKFTVRAVVNDNIVNNIISTLSGGAKSGEGSPFGFLILPRLQFEAKSFDATVVKKASASTKMVNEKVSADQVKETDGGASERNIEGDKVSMSMSAKTSGSTTRKSQQAKWRLGNSKNVNASIV